MEKFKKIVKYTGISILVALTIIGICILLIKNSTLLNPEATNIESQQIMIFGFSLDTIGLCLTIIGVPGTAIWGAFQYSKSKKLRQQEKGAEIAKLFSEELLDKCFIIGHVINESNLGNFLDFKKTDMNNLKRFDREEIAELYKDEPHFWEKYEKCLASDDLQLSYFYILERRISTKTLSEIKYKDNNSINKIIIELMSKKYSKKEIDDFKRKNILKTEFEKFYLSNHSLKDLHKIYTKNYTDKEARELFILDNSDLPFDFIKLVTDVLNELEYICMYISSQSAGTYFIYQSLHQIFLKTIKILAATIAHSNKNYSDKYYTNIIYVYREWQNIRRKTEEKEKKNKLKAFKYLEPKIRRV